MSSGRSRAARATCTVVPATGLPLVRRTRAAECDTPGRSSSSRRSGRPRTIANVSLGERLGRRPVVAVDRGDAALGEEEGDCRCAPRERVAVSTARANSASAPSASPSSRHESPWRGASSRGTGWPARARPRRARRRGASPPPRRGTTGRAGRRAWHRTVLPSASVRLADRPIGGRRPTLGGWRDGPTTHSISAPCTAIAGWRSSTLFASNHSIHRSTVSDASARPHGVGELQHEAGRPGRRRRRPGRGRWRPRAGRSPRTTPPPGGAARRRSSGLASAQLGRQQFAEQRVVAVPLAPAVERDHQQVAALQLLEHERPSRSCPTTASHSGPHMRSRIADRVRNDTCSRDTRSRNSDRR